MKRSTILVVFVSTVTAVPGLLIMLVIGRLWYNSVGPFRPRSVPKTAVLLRGPEVGFPGGPQGRWLACWESKGADRCRLSALDGTTKYESVFVPYGRKAPLPADQLDIDTNKTTEEDAEAIWLNNTWVPLIYLKNGDVLIPASQYDKGVLILDRKRMKAE